MKNQQYSIIMILFVILVGYDINNLLNNSNSENISRSSELLKKSQSTQFYLDSINLAISSFRAIEKQEGTSEGFSYDPRHVTQNNTTSFDFIIPQDTPSHAGIIYRFAPDNWIDTLKYASFLAKLSFELPEYKTESVRASFWLTCKHAVGGDPNTGESAINIEIYNDYNVNGHYKIVCDYYERWNGSISPNTLHGVYSPIIIFNDSLLSTYTINAIYRIDWHPRYIECYVNGSKIAEFDHSLASPIGMQPHITYYWLKLNGIPSKTYHMSARDVVIKSYISNKNYNDMPINLGTLNVPFKRFSFDTGIINGKSDTHYFVNNINENIIPLCGNFAGSRSTMELGYYDKTLRKFYIDNTEDGVNNFNLQFTFGFIGDYPYVIDTNGDGIDAIGVFRGSTHEFYSFDNFDDYNYDRRVYNFGSSGDIPIIGDWNGDTKDEVGFYRPNEFHRTNINEGDGQANTVNFPVQTYGYQSGDIPIVGDWNNTGTDKIGIYRISDRKFLFTINTFEDSAESNWRSLDMDDEGTYPLVYRK